MKYIDPKQLKSALKKANKISAEFGEIMQQAKTTALQVISADLSTAENLKYEIVKIVKKCKNEIKNASEIDKKQIIANLIAEMKTEINSAQKIQTKIEQNYISNIEAAESTPKTLPQKFTEISLEEWNKNWKDAEEVGIDHSVPMPKHKKAS